MKQAVNKILPVLLSLAVHLPGHAADYYVSPSGNDKWSGLSATPGGQNGPFQTLERAQAAARALKRQNPASAVTVHVGAGYYFLEKPLYFDSRDSGAPGKPAVWQGEGEGRTVISGGIELACKPYRESVQQCPLTQKPLSPHTFDTQRVKGDAPVFELFADEQRLRLARWPNEGWAHIKTPQDPKRSFSAFEALPALDKSDQARVHIIPGNDWFDQYIGVRQLNRADNSIALADDTGYPMQTGRRFYIDNAPSLLDAPGEWFYDFGQGRILLIPPSGAALKHVIVSSLPSAVAINGAKDFTLTGVAVRHTVDAGLIVKNTDAVRLKNIEIANTGKGADISASTNFLFTGSRIHHTAADGIIINGGNGRLLKPANYLVENNHIHDVGQVVMNYKPAINIAGVGIKIMHNLLANGPSQAILINGNDHLIEKNEIHHFCGQASDCGVVYSGRHWQWRGNAIRYNHIHDTIGYGLQKADIAANTVTYGSPGDTRSIYLDDGASGFDIIGNIFDNPGNIAVCIGGGRDNTVSNNYIATDRFAIWIDNRWADYHWEANQKYLQSSPYQTPVWKQKYPKLAAPMANYKWPEGNQVDTNIVVSTGGKGPTVRYFIPSRSTVIRDNVVWAAKGSFGVDYNLLDSGQKASVAWSDWLGKGVERNSVSADPCAQIKGNRLTLCSGSPALKLGFKPLPDDIGLIK